MKPRILFALIVFAVLIVAAPGKLSAQCSECKAPPPYAAIFCGNTYYNAADGCVISANKQYCMHVGSCTGELGEPCERCPREIWACGKPLSDDWRLERVTVEIARIQSNPSNTSETHGSL